MVWNGGSRVADGEVGASSYGSRAQNRDVSVEYMESEEERTEWGPGD